MELLTPEITPLGYSVISILIVVIAIFIVRRIRKEKSD